jgi:uncharacterized membrane protein YfcA
VVELGLFLIGTFAGVSGSIVGLGGGFIIVPFLIFLFSLSPAQISGTSMAVLFFTAISSTWTYSKQKRIDYKSGMAFAAAMIPGSILGAWVADFMTNRAFFVAFGIFLLCIACFLLFKPSKQVQHFLPPTVTRTFVDATGQTFTYSFNHWFGIAVAFVVGFLSSLFGIGGGSVMVPTMALLLSFPAHIAAATSMFSILLSSAVGTVSHMALHNVIWSKVLWLAPGALIGGRLGAQIAAKLPAKLLLRILATTLIIVSIRLISKT